MSCQHMVEKLKRGLLRTNGLGDKHCIDLVAQVQGINFGCLFDAAAVRDHYDHDTELAKFAQQLMRARHRPPIGVIGESIRGFRDFDLAIIRGQTELGKQSAQAFGARLLEREQAGQQCVVRALEMAVVGVLQMLDAQALQCGNGVGKRSKGLAPMQLVIEERVIEVEEGGPVLGLSRRSRMDRHRARKVCKKPKRVEWSGACGFNMEDRTTDIRCTHLGYKPQHQRYMKLRTALATVVVTTFLATAAQAQTQPAKAVNRDQLRACMNSETELTARRQNMEPRDKQNTEEAVAIRAEQEQLAAEKQKIEDERGGMDRFTRKVKAHNARILAARTNADSFRADLESLNQALGAHNQQCGGILFRSEDKEAILKEREAGKK